MDQGDIRTANYGLPGTKVEGLNGGLLGTLAIAKDYAGSGWGQNSGFDWGNFEVLNSAACWVRRAQIENLLHPRLLLPGLHATQSDAYLWAFQKQLWP